MVEGGSEMGRLLFILNSIKNKNFKERRISWDIEANLI